MFEITRYVLAITVADTHLSPIAVGWSGWQAVFGFYTLSGYLMTRVLHERYGFEWSGTAAFLANRVLRLWPAYLFVVLGTWLVLCFYPLNNFFFSLTLPRTIFEELPVLAILGQVSVDFTYLIPLPRLAPTSWSLSIEVFCYCLLAFYFAKTPKRLIALALLGAVAIASSTGYCVTHPSPYYGTYCFQNRYGVLQAGFIPFAIGGLAHFYRSVMRSWLRRHWAWMLAALLGCEALVAVSLFASVTVGPFLGVAAMMGLIAWDAGDVRPSRALDSIGRASYHLFIAHMSIAAILVVVFGAKPNTVSLFLCTVAIALGLSGFLVPLEWRLNRLRGQVSRWGTDRAQAFATRDALLAAAESPGSPGEMPPNRQPG
jgi:peptidoglycan/LPS O-acetylase OafA/YrhL